MKQSLLRLMVEATQYLLVMKNTDECLHRQGYKVLITEKNLVFYKMDEKEMAVTVYAVVDRRQDYLNIIRGL